jgi:L-fuculose-phosphate aldolase
MSQHSAAKLPRQHRESDPQFLLAAARRMLHNAGAESQVGGQVSLRAAGEDAFYVTPAQYFDETLPSDVMKLDLDLKVLDDPTGIGASPAIAFHAAIYQSHPSVNCVVHTHGVNAVVLSALREVPAPFHVYSTLFHEQVALYEDNENLTPVEEAGAISAALGDKHALLLTNHGVVHVGPDLEHTVVEGVLFEIVAGFHLQCRQAGAKPFTDSAARKYRLAYAQSRFYQQMWNSNYRRLRRSDPDLFNSLA